MKKKFNTIIVGGGFGGLHCAISLNKHEQDVLLVDQNNYHLFIPLLYQVATAGLSSTQVATPIREIIQAHKNTSVIKGSLNNIYPDKNQIQVDGENYEFENLVLAIGDKPSYFGNNHWKENSMALKSLDDALRIRNQILKSYEKAEISDDINEIQRLLTFVIIGAGPTGVELAGSISEIANETLIKDFKNIDPSQTKIYLLEAAGDVLGFYTHETSQNALKDLDSLGIYTLTEKMVKDIQKGKVIYQSTEVEDPDNSKAEELIAENIFWAAGNEGHPIVEQLDCELTKNKKVKVADDLSLKNRNNIFVIGDAAYKEQDGKPLPGQAPVAIQQGKYVADVIIEKQLPEKRKPFRYTNKGSMATIGRKKAVGEIRGVKVKGTLAWLMWSFIHLFYLIQNRNRIFTFINWGFLYIWRESGARIIHESKHESKEDK